MTTKSITLDVWEPSDVRVKVNQGEIDARFLKIKLTNKKKPLDLTGKTVVFYATKPDDNLIFNNCEIVDATKGIISLELTSQMSVAAGIMRDCEIDILDPGTTKLKVKGLTLEICRTTNFESAVESTSEFTALDIDLQNAQELIAAANQITAAQEAITQISNTVTENAENAQIAADSASTSLRNLNSVYNEAIEAIDNKEAAIVQLTTDADTIARRAIEKATNAENETAEFSNTVDSMSRQFSSMQLSLEGKVDDAFVENGYLYMTSNGETIAGPLGPFSGTGGGGTSENNAILSVTNTTGWLSTTIANGDDCPISILWSSNEDEIPTGDGTAKITVNGSVRAIFNVVQGTIDINLSPYCSTGANVVKVTISDVYNNSRTISFSVNCVAISISSSFDATIPYQGEFSFPYIPVGKVNKTIHFLLDGQQIGTNSTSVSGRQMSYTIAQQSHGAHTFEVYFDCEINGQTVESNHLYYDIICLESMNTDPIIVSSFNQSAAAQYTTLNIDYTVYDPVRMTADVRITVNDSQVAQLTVDRTEQVFTYRADTTGTLTIVIASGEVSKTINIDISESDVHVDPETDQLKLYLASTGRSNNEALPGTWVYENIQATFSNFNYKSDGWLIDDDGITVLRVAGDARVTIPYMAFASDFRTTGKTIEIEFATRDVMDYSSVIMSCMSGGRGFSITPQLAQLVSEQSKISMQYKEGEHVRISFVVEKRSQNRLMYIYVNGIMSGVVQYPSNDDFSQADPVGISIGSNDCTIDLYCIRVYDNNLERGQILNNWIADTQDVIQMLARYHRNAVYDEYGNISISRLPSDLPYLVIECPELPQYKGDKKTVDITYVDPVTPFRSFSATGAEANVQGTSSQYYARKNYKIKFKNGFNMNNGSHTAKYPLRPEAISTDTFCFKADVASSEGANNVELARLYNDTCPYKTPAQLENSAIRQGIDGFPIVIFWNDGQNTTFLGKYNFNNDKGTEEVFGFTDGDESWEIKNNTSNRVLWKSADFTSTVTDEHGNVTPAWLNDFEARYPENNIDETNLKTLAQWLVSTDQSAASGNELSTSYTDVDGTIHTVDNAAYRLAKFKTELTSYMEKSAVEFYYLFTELFLMVDSRAKNAFPSFFKNGKWFSLPYDFDTALGINNEGSLAFSYNLEDIDTLTGGAEVFNGQQSVLWVNLRQAFYDEIKTMYQNLRSTGSLSYAKVEEMFETHQEKWGEAIFNEDAYLKYLQPLIDDGSGAYLSMLQGSKSEQRKWWLYNRFRYIDSKYNAGDSLSDVVQLRGYAKSDVTITPYADVYASVKYGSYLVQTRASRNQSYTLACPLDNVNDTEIYIYSASQLTSVGDLSGLKVGYADFSMGTRLQSIKLGDNANEYSNGNLQELYLGNNVLLKTLDVRNCHNLGQGDMKTVDISGCKNIENIYFDGTSVTGIDLPVGGILKVLHLPSTITNLTIRNQTAITDFTIASCSNITTLWLDNVSNVINEKAILRAIPPNSRVRLANIYWEAQDAQEIEDLFDILDTMRGLDEYGNNMDSAQIFGTIHTNTLTSLDIVNLNRRYPHVNVSSDHTITYIKYYNYDGSELIYTESILDGGDGSYSGNPARESTAQYSYSFVGWSRSMNSTTAEADAKQNVVADRNLYAAYAATVRTYTVTWKNSDNTILETDTNVPYGTRPTYNGSTPQNPVSGGENFKGWSPTISSVTGDITYTACYPTYNVYFYNGTTLLQTVTLYTKGATATYTGATPDKGIGFVFDSWNPQPTNIQEDTSCYAQFQEVWEETEISDSWDDIILAANNGTYKNKYKHGNYKPLDLGAEGIVNMQIVALGKEPLANGDGNAPISWISKELLTSSHRMNPQTEGSTGNYTEGTGAIGGWGKSEMRTWLKDTIKPLIPLNVRSAIKSVTKYSVIYNISATAQYSDTSTDDVWIPGNSEYSALKRGNISTIKNKVGESGATTWWLKDAPTGASYFYGSFRCVNSSGDTSICGSAGTLGVALGFCI